MINRSKRVGALFAKAVAAGVLVATAGLAQAGFVAIGTDQVLDTTSNLIWLKNWSATGAADWQTQKNWAAGLTTGGVTAGTWRLPTGDGSLSAGPANEFLQLWDDVDPAGPGGSFAGLQSVFDGVQADHYWSGSENSAHLAWVFRTDLGLQGFLFKPNLFIAVAVRSGDVVAAVPEPESLALVLVGLVAAGVARRRRPL